MRNQLTALQNMNGQLKNKPTDQPLALAHFGTFAFLPTRQPNTKNAKEPKFSSRTATPKRYADRFNFNLQQPDKK